VTTAFLDKQGEQLPQELMSVPDTSDIEFCATKDTPALHFAVPLVSTEGMRLGTICHFDTAARALADEDFEFLHLDACVFLTSLTHEQPAYAFTSRHCLRRQS